MKCARFHVSARPNSTTKIVIFDTKLGMPLKNLPKYQCLKFSAYVITIFQLLIMREHSCTLDYIVGEFTRHRGATNRHLIPPPFIAKH